MSTVISTKTKDLKLLRYVRDDRPPQEDRFANIDKTQLGIKFKK